MSTPNPATSHAPDQGNSGGGAPHQASPAAHPDRSLSLRVSTLPRDTNHYGTIFGGVILSYIDQAGAVEARKQGRHRWVTAAIDRVDFRAPVRVGDVVNLYTQVVRLGTKSVTVQVQVEAERFTTGEIVLVTDATVTMVAVDEHGTPIAFRMASTL
jgi:acyl-CoA thioesterase YciA